VEREALAERSEENNDVQIVATVLSVDPEVDPDIPAMIGASAAVSLAGIPFNGPIGAARVGYANGQYILNPTKTELDRSQLNLVVAGTEAAVLMVESEAQELPEEVMLGAVVFGHQQQQAVIELIHQLVEEGGKPLWDWQPPSKDEALIARVASVAESEMREAYRIRSKQARSQRIKEIGAKVDAQCVDADASPDARRHAGNVLFDLEAKIVREQILSGEPRIDGRDTRTVRPIRIRTGVLPRTHGSALFTRGETQALVVATLGTSSDEQRVDALIGEHYKKFMLHYNFPPFSTGEVKFLRGPGRREIGHGALAERAIAAMLPDEGAFPYTIRIVSEVLESNGSSSMATVCGASLALMDAGVPTKAPVAGVAMGLIREGNEVRVLSDILGDEDHLGDMDFKVAGTKAGVTALQMDIKIGGVTREVMSQALEQAREARLHILGIMTQTLDQPREEMSMHAPRIVTIKINPDRIRDLIGPGGKTIRGIVEETGAKIDVEDDGTVLVASADGDALQRALERIRGLTAEAEVGKIYRGTVRRVVDFGAFVEIMPGTDGLVHISQLAPERVRQVTDVVHEGDVIDVKVLEIDKSGKIRLSRKEALRESASN